MIVFKKKIEITAFLSAEKGKGQQIGFVPTMGALHEGHIALIRTSRTENNITVCSIFINPTQFNNPEDYSRYPVKINSDLTMLESTGCGVVFIPDNKEMYENYSDDLISFNLGYLETICEGKYRPGHFKGVSLIVTKLFNIISPDKAYFGQKDLQQFAVIKKLVKDLSYNIKLRRVPTVREPDGLAMSSRNLLLSAEDRPGANILFNSLVKARKLLLDGSSVDTIKKIIRNQMQNEPASNLEYFELVDAESFAIIQNYEGQPNLAFCMAAYYRNIRLIDNIFIIE